MKKLLLFVAIAMTAMTANAQKADRSLSLMEQMNATSFTNGSMSVVLNQNAQKFGLKKAAGNTLELISAEDDQALDETPILGTSSIEIYLPQEAEDGVYKAKTSLGNLDGCEWDILVAEDMSKITIPVNQEYDDPEYGLIYMWGLIEKEDGVYYDDENDIVFNLNEDGMYECENVGWAMKMTGEYEQYVWTSSWYPTWLKPNGVENGSLGKSGWTEYSNPIFVEDLGDEVNIYNFFGYTKLNILYDEEEGYLLIPMSQPIYPLSSSIAGDTYGYYFRILGVDVTEDGYLHVNEDKEYTSAYFIEFNEAGDDLLPSTRTILTDPTRDGYMGIFSQFDEEGSGYYMGYLHGVSFTLNEGEYRAVSSSIKNVNNDVKSNGKIYNLAGQQVSAATKGIVIVDGKKVIK